VCAAHCKNWLAWGEYLDSLAEASGDATVSQEALVCFLQALKAATPADVSADEFGGGIKKRDADASQSQQQQQQQDGGGSSKGNKLHSSESSSGASDGGASGGGSCNVGHSSVGSGSGSPFGRLVVARVLGAIANDDETGTLRRLAETFAVPLPASIWLPWLPQLISSLARPEAMFARAILMKVASQFPQVI